MSLRARMGLAAGVAVALAVIAVSVSAYAGTRSTLLGQIDTELRGITVQVLHTPHGGIGPGGGNGFTGGGPPVGNGIGGGRGLITGQDCDGGLGLNGPSAPAFGGAAGFVQLIQANGSVCRGTGEKLEIPSDPRATALARTGSGQYSVDKTVDGIAIRVLVSGVQGKGALEVALPLSDVNHTLSNELLLMVIIAAAGIALAALLGILVARTALSPIARFTRQTEAIAAAPALLETERVEVSGKDELARLARTFNATLDTLEQSVAAQRNLVADASHELRTPIASIRANLQLLREESRLPEADRAALREDMIEELDELTALVSDVVELARGSRPSGEVGDVRLDEIVTSVVERTRRRGPELTIKASIEPTLVRGEADRIARAVTNVLDNARKWSSRDGVIEVELHGGTLSVRDHGPGFHDDDLPFVFDRFHRAKDARGKPGSGLGLAIVRQAAEAHGGFAEAGNAPGGGAVLRLGFGPAGAPERDPVDPAVAS
ncbi:MAG TPA: HAMP domain-containing sensor histidine kinase [Solirubrobacteraceae bacterium]|nr:HAMP domain-containing sensor histidine kinase [Solirubrobacteraceae bacterium]